MKDIIIFLAAFLFVGCSDSADRTGVVCGKITIPARTRRTTTVIPAGKGVVPIVNTVHKPAKHIVFAFDEDGDIYKCEVTEGCFAQINEGDTIFGNLEPIGL